MNLGATVDTTLTDPVAYNWQITDSSGDTLLQSTDPNLSYTFADPDTYTVTLAVSVDNVTSAPVTSTITVNNLAPSFVGGTIPESLRMSGRRVTLSAGGLHRPRLVEHAHRHDRLGRRHRGRRRGDGRIVRRHDDDPRHDHRQPCLRERRDRAPTRSR